MEEVVDSIIINSLKIDYEIINNLKKIQIDILGIWNGNGYNRIQESSEIGRKFIEKLKEEGKANDDCVFNFIK